MTSDWLWSIEQQLFAISNRIVVYIALMTLVLSSALTLWGMITGRLSRVRREKTIAYIEALQSATRPPARAAGRELIDFKRENADREGSWEHYVYGLQRQVGDEFRSIFILAPRAVANVADDRIKLFGLVGYSTSLILIALLVYNCWLYYLSYDSSFILAVLLFAGAALMVVFSTHRLVQRYKVSRDVALAYLAAMSKQNIFVGVEFTRKLTTDEKLPKEQDESSSAAVTTVA